MNADELAEIERLLAPAPFVDVAVGARADAKATKHDLQVDRARTPGIERLDAIVMRAIGNHAVIRAAVLPKMVLTPLYSRHEPGMDDGLHADVPLLGQPTQIRTDASVTVFLSDPATYDGGELAVATEIGEARVKLPKGDAVIHDGGMLHRVLPVTKGARLAAVTWMQSLVRDADKRETLFDLDRAARILNERAPNTDQARLATKAHGNLFRMWADV